MEELFGGTALNTLILIGIGGFIGAIFRYSLCGWVQNVFLSFPAGTLSVNFIGSLLLSFIMYSTEYKDIFNEETRIFLTIGLLGSFTTMSAFSYESFKLFESKESFIFVVNVAATLISVLFAIYLGRFIASSVFK